MAIYKGTISGTGSADTRKNEITPGELSTVRNFICGYNLNYKNIGGVIKNQDHDFDCKISETEKNLVHITDGLCFAYGYFGHGEPVDIMILPPAVEQYHIIYVELNRSVIPNFCTVKTKNNQSSSTVSINTFRQDQLTTIKTGVFQIPLWLLRVTNKGIQEATDLRNLRNYIESVVYSDQAKHVTDGGILGRNVTIPTPPVGDNSKKIANTEWVYNTIKTEINK